MKKFIKYIFLLAGVSLLGQGCYEEDKLTASGEEPFLSYKDLPQGNHDYDERIMEWYNDYNVLTFYRFDEKEFWWTPTGDIRPKPADDTEGGTSSGYLGIEADTNYVGELVKLLDEEFYAYYTRECLDKRMPKKILLMGELTFTPSSSLDPEFAPKERVWCHMGYDRFAINMANEDILTMTDEMKRDFRHALHGAFLLWQVAFGFIETNEEFLTISDYGISFPNSNETGIRNFYGEGFISEKGKVPETDWEEYIKAIVTHTYEELIGEIDPAVYDDKGKFSATLWRTKSDQNLGMLNRDSKKGWDKNGKINEKYEIVTTYFKEKYNIDLQAIGNGQKLNK